MWLRAARSATSCTSGPSLTGGSSRVAVPSRRAWSSRASACRLAWVTASMSRPWPTSSRSRPAGPVSSAGASTCQGISATSSAGSDGCPSSSSHTGRAASRARQVWGGNSSGSRGLDATSTTRVTGAPPWGSPDPSGRVIALGRDGRGPAEAGGGGRARAGGGLALDHLAVLGVPAAEAGVDDDVGRLDLLVEPALDGLLAAVLDGRLELGPELVVELGQPHPDDLEDVVAELGLDRLGDRRLARTARLALAVALAGQLELGRLERLDGRPLGVEAEVASLVLALGVDRALLGHRRPVATRDQLLADRVGGRLVLDQHMADVDLEEVVLALVEGLAQLGVGRVRDQLDRDQVDRQLDPLLGAEDLLGDLPGLEQLLVVLALGGHLLLELLHAGVDVGLLDRHAFLPRPVQHQLELDQALEGLAGRPLDVLAGLLTLLLGGLLLLLAQLGLGHLGEAGGRDADAVDRGRVLVADPKARAAGGEDGETQDEEQAAHRRPHTNSTTTMPKHTGDGPARGATMPR